MQITILTTGSRGDAQPYPALGLGLQQAGYSVQIATHPPFESLGVGTQPIPKNMLTVERLAAALPTVKTDERMRSRAATIGEKIRVKTGGQTAVAAIQHHLENH